MILRYCKGFVKPENIVLPKVNVISMVTDREGNSYPVQVFENCDMSQFGTFKDWSLDSMRKTGINPESFVSPILSITRLESSNVVRNIDIPDNI